MDKSDKLKYVLLKLVPEEDIQRLEKVAQSAVHVLTLDSNGYILY